MHILFSMKYVAGHSANNIILRYKRARKISTMGKNNNCLLGKTQQFAQLTAIEKRQELDT